MVWAMVALQRNTKFWIRIAVMGIIGIKRGNDTNRFLRLFQNLSEDSRVF